MYGLDHSFFRGSVLNWMRRKMDAHKDSDLKAIAYGNHVLMVSHGCVVTILDIPNGLKREYLKQSGYGSPPRWRERVSQEDEPPAGLADSDV